RRGSRRESSCILIIPAILKESPHRPDQAPVASSKLQPMTPVLPAQEFADFNHCVPGMHRCGRERITQAVISLHAEPSRSERPFPAETHTLNSEFGNDVIILAVLRGPVHCESGNSEGDNIHESRVEHAIPRNVALLREVVMERAEAWKILRHETLFRT